MMCDESEIKSHRCSKGLVTEWEKRPLNALYPAIQHNYIVTKIRHDGRVSDKLELFALSINIEGQRVDKHAIS